MSAMIDPFIEQEAFRFGADGTETGHGFLQAQSVDISAGSGLDTELDALFFLRIRLAETAGATSTLQNQSIELQYSHDGGAFTNVTASSSVVQAIASGNIADAADCTERLTGGATTFMTTNGGFDEVDGVAGGGAMDIAGDEFAEVMFSIQVIDADVANAETIDFRITRAGGTVMDNEATADEPRITVTKDNIIAGSPSAGTGLSTLDATSTTFAAGTTNAATGLSTLDAAGLARFVTAGTASAGTGLSTLDATSAHILTGDTLSTTGLSTLDATSAKAIASDIVVTGLSTVAVPATTTFASGTTQVITGLSTLDAASTTFASGTTLATTGLSTLDAVGAAIGGSEIIAGDPSTTGLAVLDATGISTNASDTVTTGLSTLDAVGAKLLTGDTLAATGLSTLDAASSSTHGGDGAATGLSTLGVAGTKVDGQAAAATGSSALDATGSIGVWSATAAATGSSTLNATSTAVGAVAQGGFPERRRRRQRATR